MSKERKPAKRDWGGAGDDIEAAVEERRQKEVTGCGIRWSSLGERILQSSWKGAVSFSEMLWRQK